MAITKEPWQNGPTELIEFALSHHLRGASDFDQRIAFLVLDVGVETLFKTFLTLPDKVTGTTVPFGDRKKAADGHFHDLVNGLERAAGARVKGFNLAHVEFYHDLRNKLYHQGNGITIPTEKVHGYAELAINLLKALLAVDLTAELLGPEIEAKAIAAAKQKEEQTIAAFQEQVALVRQAVAKIQLATRIGIELIEPRLALPRTEMHYRALLEEFHRKPASISDIVMRKTEWRDALCALHGNLDLADIASLEDDFTEYLLIILQRTMPDNKQPMLNNCDWSALYNDADHFPEWDKHNLTKYTDDDSGMTIDAEEPTLEDLTESGKKHVTLLEAVRKAILEWAGQHNS